jgi:DNA-binding NtrC family response regulator
VDDIAKALPGAVPPLEALVVDDEADVRDLVAEHLRARAVGVTAVNGGQAAIAALARTPSRFALIVTDLQLPDVDGLAVLRAARAANPSCAVVIITGYASLPSAIEAVRLGAYDYLTKPFSLGQIDVVLQRLRDRHALEAENRHLMWQLRRRPEESASSRVIQRLDGIEARLARIETLLKSR